MNAIKYAELRLTFACYASCTRLQANGGFMEITQTIRCVPHLVNNDRCFVGGRSLRLNFIGILLPMTSLRVIVEL